MFPKLVFPGTHPILSRMLKGLRRGSQTQGKGNMGLKLDVYFLQDSSELKVICQ